MDLESDLRYAALFGFYLDTWLFSPNGIKKQKNRFIKFIF